MATLFRFVLLYFTLNTGTGVMPSTTTVWPDTSIGTDGDSDVFTDFSSTTITEPNLNTTGNYKCCTVIISIIRTPSLEGI